MSLDVFPRSNLGEDSLDWARSIEARARSVAYSIQNTGTASSMDNRAIASQLGALSRQVDELERQAQEIENRNLIT